MKTTERCSEEVRLRGFAFPHYKQCKRKAVTMKDGKPVCQQHSHEAEEARKAKAIAADERRMKLWYALRHLRPKRTKPTA